MMCSSRTLLYYRFVKKWGSLCSSICIIIVTRTQHGFPRHNWTRMSPLWHLYLPHRLTCVMPQVLISHTLRPNGIPISQVCFSSQMGIRWSQSSTWGKNVGEAKVQWYPPKDNIESRDGISLRRKSSLEYLYSSPLSGNANPLTIHAATRPYHMICQKRQDEETLLWHASGYYFCCN